MQQRIPNKTYLKEDFQESSPAESQRGLFLEAYFLHQDLLTDPMPTKV